MSVIHVVSASAGSGKTYRLVSELEQAIMHAKSPARPEAVIATTFTVKAAAELRERVRARLLERGLVAQAQQLAMARIGTVNSVCAEMIGEYAFELGLAPETRTLEEAAARAAFERSLADLVGIVRDEDGQVVGGSEAAVALLALEERMPGLDWLKRVHDIVDYARANLIDAAALRAGSTRSINGLLVHLPAAASDGAVLHDDLRRALEAFVANPALDPTKTTAQVVDVCKRFIAELGRGHELAWTDWARLAKSEPGAKSRAHYAPVLGAARAGERHPRLATDVREAITHVFELAAQALEAYQSYKSEWGLLDFVDQERLALELLQRPRVRAMLAEQLDLVLVDEFQDTSPLQLELFLALASIAPRSVWVGDQKQAIYGFRGTDPALMDATVAAIEARGDAGGFDTLQHSWRSRAPLVRLTSAVFAPAFEAQGIPAERVRLEPAPETPEPDELGAAVEVWQLQTKVKDDDAAAVAAGVAQMLADSEVQVRDLVTGDSRRARPADIAVLCRRKADTHRMATALEALGVPAVLGRSGLATTLEARAVLAALRLWVDARDSLAAAELGRLVSLPHDPDAWLLHVLDAGGRPFEALPEVVRVSAARREVPTSGVLAAFDAAIEAVGMHELCLRWGSEQQRLANLDELRAIAVRYTAQCAAERETPTVAGLVAYLATLADDEKDKQATPSGQDAVTVSTLHGAKGLEWPLTVLFAVNMTREPSAFDVHVMNGPHPFSFEKPLASRWIRYWPDPFAPRPNRFGGGNPARGSMAVHAAVDTSPERQSVLVREAKENLRLLYVGWTRARDRVVLATRSGKLLESGFEVIADRGGKPLLAEPAADGLTSWAGHAFEAKLRGTGRTDDSPAPVEPGEGYVARGPREFAPAFVNPSTLRAAGRLGTPEVIGAGVSVAPGIEGAAIGDACHGYFAADPRVVSVAGASTGTQGGSANSIDPVALAVALLVAHGAEHGMRAEELVRAAAELRAWVARRWPNARWRREWPVRHRLPDGSELNGYADLVLEMSEGLVLIDHKCLGGTREEALVSAIAYGGQLAAYTAALEAATGRPVLERWLHLVLQGECVRME